MNATHATATRDVFDILEQVAPRRVWRDPFGLLSGYRAYQIAGYFYGMSDEKLKSYGLTRGDIPKVAMQAIFDARDARKDAA